MLEFFWPLIRPFAWLARLLRKIARTLFGQLSWKPPYWLQRGAVRVHLYRRAHPYLVAGGVLLALLLATGSLWTWRWYQRQPKPHRVFATVAPISVTPLEK
ncbi:MAG: alpha-2-macroglobulin, partial [Verrucomicrobiota bacterium]